MSSTDMNKHLLDVKLDETAKVKQCTPTSVSKLGTFIERADDYELFRMNPIQFAAERSIKIGDCIDFFYMQRNVVFSRWSGICFAHSAII